MGYLAGLSIHSTRLHFNKDSITTLGTTRYHLSFRTKIKFYNCNTTLFLFFRTLSVYSTSNVFFVYYDILFEKRRNSDCIQHLHNQRNSIQSFASP
jgi:hypothetical protein